MKAFIRWVIKKPVNTLIIQIPTQAVFFPDDIRRRWSCGQYAEWRWGCDGNDGDYQRVCFVSFAVAVLCSGIYWMAAFDEEKRTLHDRMCGTRVIKK